MDAFSHDSTAILTRQQENAFTLDERECTRLAQNGPAFRAYYQLDATVAFVRQHQLHRLAVQFPDVLLQHAQRVVHCLQHELPNVFWFVLGDTSYGSCCVDEVAAQHLQADGVIHYGRACLSPVSTLPVFYVFGQTPICIDDCVQQVRQQVDLVRGKTKVLLVYDPRYLYAMPEIHAKLTSTITLDTFMATMKTEDHPKQSVERATTTLFLGGQSVAKRDIAAVDESVLLVYIGPQEQQLINILLQCNRSACVRYDPQLRSCGKESFSVNKTLMRR